MLLRKKLELTEASQRSVSKGLNQAIYGLEFRGLNIEGSVDLKGKKKA